MPLALTQCFRSANFKFRYPPHDNKPSSARSFIRSQNKLFSLFRQKNRYTETVASTCCDHKTALFKHFSLLVHNWCRRKSDSIDFRFTISRREIRFSHSLYYCFRQPLGAIVGKLVISSLFLQSIAIKQGEGRYWKHDQTSLTTWYIASFHDFSWPNFFANCWTLSIRNTAIYFHCYWNYSLDCPCPVSSSSTDLIRPETPWSDKRPWEPPRQKDFVQRDTSTQMRMAPRHILLASASVSFSVNRQTRPPV